MARYFGGFRDRLKKRSKHLPITVKDVEWIKVATTFTWSPARREYQWLEPEDYLSSFLSSSDGAFDAPVDLSQESQGDGSVEPSAEMAFTGTEYDGSESLIGMPVHEKDEGEDGKIPYIPPFDYVNGQTPGEGDDGILRPNINVPAELPLLDEYKLEIVSALLRRGIRVGVDKIKLPVDLTGQLNDYHEGRVSIDSYELRSRLQKFKKQVIESFEHFSSVSSPIRSTPIDVSSEVHDDEKNPEEEDTYLILEPFEDEEAQNSETQLDQVFFKQRDETSVIQVDATPAAGEEEYESFILSSLNRLEASMNEVDRQDESMHELPVSNVNLEETPVVFEDPDEVAEILTRPIRNNRSVETPQNTSDVLAEGAIAPDLKEFANPNELPSSFADDSWLVLPVDSRKAGFDLENPENAKDEPFAAGNEENETTHSPDLLDAFEEDDDPSMESTRADSSDLLKALNTINSRLLDSSLDDDLDLSVSRGIFDEEEDIELAYIAEAPDKVQSELEASDSEKPQHFETQPSALPTPETQNPERQDAEHQFAEHQFAEHKETEAGHLETQDGETPAVESEQETSLTEILLKLRNNGSMLEDEPDIELSESNTPVVHDTPEVEAHQDKVASVPTRDDTGERGESSSETVEQQRARYIEEERKKLYSLIDDLEVNATPGPEETQPEMQPEMQSEMQSEEITSEEVTSGEVTSEERRTEDDRPIVNDEPIEMSARLVEDRPLPLDLEPEVTNKAAHSPEDLKAELARLRASVELNRRSALSVSETEKEEADSQEEAQQPSGNLNAEPVVVQPSEPEVETSVLDKEGASEAVPEAPVAEIEEISAENKNLIDPEPGSLDLMSNPNGEIEVAPEEAPQKKKAQSELVSPESAPETPAEPAPVRSFGSLDMAVTRRIAEEKTEKASPDSKIRHSVREESSQNEPAVSLGVSEQVFSEPVRDSKTEPEAPAKNLPTEGSSEVTRLAAEIVKQRMKQSVSKASFVNKDKEAGTESVKVHSESKDQRAMAEPQTTEQETTPTPAPAKQEPVVPAQQEEPAEASAAEVDAYTDVESVDEGMTAVVSASTEMSEEEDLTEIREDEGLIEAEEALENEVPLTGVIESLAFATEDPIPLKKIARIYSELLGVRQPTEKMMRDALKTLNDHYAETGRSYRIKEWAGGIRMASHPQYARFIRAIYQDHRPKKLSRTLMETLAIIAYSQPTTKPEIDFVRGVDSDYAVRKLLELGLIDIVGRSESIGRPLLYGTSERFLEQFGLSEIEALPKLREVEDLLGDPAFKKERLQLLALEEMDAGVSEGDGAASSDVAEPSARAGASSDAIAENKPAQPDAAAGETAAGASN